MPLRAAVVLAAGAATLAFAQTAPGAPPEGCRLRFGEKLGIPYVWVCRPGEPGGFWITATVHACSAGSHESIRCPVTTPVGALRETSTSTSIEPRTTALVDKAAALRTCGLRMGGRLPTRAERVRAREVLGLATVMVTESPGEAAAFRFAELPEWVTAEPCDNPNIVGSCDIGWYPSDAPSSGVPWKHLRACRFTRSEAVAVGTVELGDACPVTGWKWNPGEASQPLPCRIHDPSRTAAGERSAASFTVACRPPSEQDVLEHPPEVPTETAAYRCVLPEAALGTFDR